MTSELESGVMGQAIVTILILRLLDAYFSTPRTKRSMKTPQIPLTEVSEAADADSMPELTQLQLLGLTV